MFPTKLHVTHMIGWDTSEFKPILECVETCVLEVCCLHSFKITLHYQHEAVNVSYYASFTK